jgi:hypothetical protein
MLHTGCLFQEVTRYPTVFEKTGNIRTGNFFALPFPDTDAGSMAGKRVEEFVFGSLPHLSGFSLISDREAYPRSDLCFPDSLTRRAAVSLNTLAPESVPFSMADTRGLDTGLVTPFP